MVVYVVVVVVGMVVWLVDASPYLTSAAVRKECVAPEINENSQILCGFIPFYKSNVKNCVVAIS